MKSHHFSNEVSSSHQDLDGIVRVISITISCETEFQRPASKLAPLPSCQDEEDIFNPTAVLPCDLIYIFLSSHLTAGSGFYFYLSSYLLFYPIFLLLLYRSLCLPLSISCCFLFLVFDYVHILLIYNCIHL